MAPSLSVESESTIVPLTMKDVPVSATIDHAEDLTDDQHPVQIDPLATTTSVPSSDDGLDDDGTDDSIDEDSTADNKNDAVVIATEQQESTHSPTTTTTTATITAAEKEDTTVTAIATEAVEFSENISAPVVQPQEEVKEDPSMSIEKPAAVKEEVKPQKEEEVTEKDMPLKTSFDQGEQLEKEKDQEQEQEPRKSLSRPLSRQDLRRKSSFFNSKDIAVSDRRYASYSSSSSSSLSSSSSGSGAVSTAVSSSMRPIADPRFKSRFQSILSQWKARDGN